MSRYYFDIKDERLTTDDTGLEFPNAHAARDAAIQALPPIARDALARWDGSKVSVLMRSHDGRPLFRASLSLDAEWLVDTA